MKVGITLPQFRDDAEAAIVTARAAEDAGLDGVFVFDHLWPIGQPDRPVLQSFALLGALAVETTRVDIGPLVARVGLVPEAVFIHQFETLERMLGDRLIAAIGAGDRASKEENVAFGVEYPSAAVRLGQVADSCRQLRTRGITTWAGGRSAGLRRVAAAEADALNVWEATPDEARAELADVRHQAGDRHVELTWGGRVHVAADDTVARLRELADAGVSYAILSPLEWDDEQSAVKTLGKVAAHLR